MVCETNYSLCGGCDGKCCQSFDRLGHPIVTADELKTIKRRYGADRIKRYFKQLDPRVDVVADAFRDDESILRPTGLHRIVPYGTKKCPFLGDEGCRIYNYRPTYCMLYPFTINAGRDGLYLALHYSICRDDELDMNWVNNFLADNIDEAIRLLKLCGDTFGEYMKTDHLLSNAKKMAAKSHRVQDLPIDFLNGLFGTSNGK